MSRDSFSNGFFALAAVVLCLLGALAGTAASWVSNEYQVIPQLQRLEDRVSRLAVATSTVTVPAPVQNPVEVVPVENRPLTPAYPAAFADRRTSALLLLVKRGKGDGLPVADERIFGAAVAVTSDGWIATPDAAIAGQRLADMAVEVDGHVRPVEKGVRDLSTGVDYLKITASDLPTPAFARAGDIVMGAPVWRESAPLAIAPELVTAVHVPNPLGPVSSERAARRFLVTAPAGTQPGSAIWDGAGRLVGLIESVDDVGTARAIPAGTIGSALSQFLQTGSIVRASLGVRGYDLSGLTLDAPTSTQPELGVWLQPDRKTGATAVSPKGPSAKLLFEGDVIQRIERDTLDGTADLGERLGDYRPGVSVQISGMRKGQSFQAQVTLGTETVSESIK
ncbi:MAG TPA: S1C family serine protease [Verrucomicrobiae bacterium]|nr:S1C family serine protease [Verrucomicrobiae bacterium]